MHKTKYGNVYESIEDLINNKPVSITENRNSYFFKMKPDGDFDNSIWKVDKKTLQVSYMMYTKWLLDEADNCREITMSELKKTMK